jgi:hypothetical protein
MTLHPGGIKTHDLQAMSLHDAIACMLRRPPGHDKNIFVANCFQQIT